LRRSNDSKANALTDELRHLCEGVLSNADAWVSLDERTDTIRITFVAAQDEISFECSGFHLFQVVKDYSDSDGLMVGATAVTAYSAESDVRRLLDSAGWQMKDTPNELFLIETRGAIEIRVLCARFAWRRRSLRPDSGPSN
jgi:hypothetical protein